MSKLIVTYRQIPSSTNRKKLEVYLMKHMMALCLAAPEEIEFLKAHQFI